jgi:hypothetical protein
VGELHALQLGTGLLQEGFTKGCIRLKRLDQNEFKWGMFMFHCNLFVLCARLLLEVSIFLM